MKINANKILSDGDLTEEGEIILTKYYYDQLLHEEKMSIFNINRNIGQNMTFSNIQNIQEVMSILEDYVSICRSLVPQVYREINKKIQSMTDGMETLNTGSKLINHLVKLIIPFH